jgi:rhomboid-like protein
MIGSYLYAMSWSPPTRATRMYPTQTLSTATIGGLIALNALICLAWRFPPAWRLLNTYFITCAAVVRSPSLLGATFSHQTFKHLAINMVALTLFGPTLCEQIGRGNFLALYIASGVVGNLTSLTALVLTNSLRVTTLGASASIAGIIAAFCYLNPE